MKKRIKEWTILIYANGNNELQPEMWKSKSDAEIVGSNDNVNVIMQISKSPNKIVKIIRPNDKIQFSNDDWNGVRQYHIEKGSSKLINNLGNVNMADPRTLYNFISWGMKVYPAKKYSLVLSGHGSPYTAILPDFSQNMPYAMSITGMCKAINMIKDDIGNNIDILILDICDMNSAEVLYELGKNKDNTVKRILTYIDNGPISGIPYDILIYNVEQNYLFDSDYIVKKIIENINLNLIGFKLDNGKLKSAKKIISELAYYYINNTEYIKIDNFNLQSNETKAMLENYFFKLNKELFHMIIYYKKISNNLKHLIKLNQISADRVGDCDNLIYIYSKLSFAKNNYWTYVFARKTLNEPINYNAQTYMKPSILPPKGVENLIKTMNPGLESNEVNFILNALYKYKEWNY